MGITDVLLAGVRFGETFPLIQTIELGELDSPDSEEGEQG